MIDYGIKVRLDTKSVKFGRQRYAENIPFISLCMNRVKFLDGFLSVAVETNLSN
jgi:hypothetical protein